MPRPHCVLDGYSTTTSFEAQEQLRNSNHVDHSENAAQPAQGWIEGRESATHLGGLKLTI